MDWQSIGIGFVAGIIVAIVVGYAAVSVIARDWPKD